MVTTLRASTRKARKPYCCGMCATPIKVGERHHVYTNLYDGRVYDWRECVGCVRDSIVNYVHDWSGGHHDEGVCFEQASEWAEEAVGWPKHWIRYNRPIRVDERLAARNWLARTAGGEGE